MRNGTCCGRMGTNRASRRARASRFSQSACSSSTTAPACSMAARYSGAARSREAATSRVVRSPASGVRSSWLTSAVNRFSRMNDSRSRTRSWLILATTGAISSGNPSDGRTLSNRDASSSEILAASARVERNPRDTTSSATPDAASNESRVKLNNHPRTSASVSTSSSVPRATTTVTNFSETRDAVPSGRDAASIRSGCRNSTPRPARPSGNARSANTGAAGLPGRARSRSPSDGDRARTFPSSSQASK